MKSDEYEQWRYTWLFGIGVDNAMMDVERRDVIRMEVDWLQIDGQVRVPIYDTFLWAFELLVRVKTILRINVFSRIRFFGLFFLEIIFGFCVFFLSCQLS